MKVLDHVPNRFLPRAAATGRIAASFGKAAAKRLFRSSDADDRQLGDALLGELDQLKGIAMKVGQILSYMDVGLPDRAVERLTQLQRGTRPLAFATIRETLEAELQRPISELFDDIDEEPVAAASIGQVHRARLGDELVAVKVRYPGIEETVDGDFKQLQQLGRLASIGSAVDGPAIVQELRERMVEECDYAREATWQTGFAARYARDPDIEVPEVKTGRCTPAVLTTQWQEGESFEALCQAAPERRNAVAKTLIRFTFESLVGGGVLQADPHPGNFLFPGGARIVALDFGCVKRFPPETLDAWRRLSRVVITGDRAGFDAAALASGQVGRADRFDYDEFWDFQRWLYAPWLEEHFRFERGWLRQGMQWTGPTAANVRNQAMPPAWLWLLRIEAGLHAVLVRLDAEGDFRSVFLEALDTPYRPLPGPDQET